MRCCFLSLTFHHYVDRSLLFSLLVPLGSLPAGRHGIEFFDSNLEFRLVSFFLSLFLSFSLSLFLSFSPSCPNFLSCFIFFSFRFSFFFALKSLGHLLFIGRFSPRAPFCFSLFRHLFFCFFLFDFFLVFWVRSSSFVLFSISYCVLAFDGAVISPRKLGKTR